jgi:hypothetical protein
VRRHPVLQEMYFEGEEIFHKLDSMSPMYYIVSGRVRLTENGSISWRDSGMLLGAEVLDIAAGIPSYTQIFSLCLYLSLSHTHMRVHTHLCVHMSVPMGTPSFLQFSRFFLIVSKRDLVCPFCLQKGARKRIFRFFMMIIMCAWQRACV